jgi:DNA-binding response OmpR family regulator
MSKVLIIDDQQNLLELYKLELEDEGYEVITAGTGTEAMDIIDRQPLELSAGEAQKDVNKLIEG